MSLAFESIKDQIWELLSGVPDPEIPVISVVELGIVRDVEVGSRGILITITPTYSGCPAMNVFEQDILSTLIDKGYKRVKIKTTYTPAWTTDWLTNAAKKKLKEYGIAPPVKNTEDKNALFQDHGRKVACPYCDSKHTHLTSQFGSTVCKALYFCDACQQPFEYFKCI